jgi:O-antigen ligase
MKIHYSRFTIRFRKIETPFIVWLVFVFVFIGSASQFSILGKQIAGWAWVIPFCISMFMIVKRWSRIVFPIHIWFPWICIVVLYFIDSGFSYLQRNILLVCPVVVGMAVSTSRITEMDLEGFLELARILMLALVVTVVVKTGLLFTGIFPSLTALAPQSITAAILCCVFAAGYSFNIKQHLFFWGLGACIPIIALTRTAITVVGMTIPLTFASLRLRKRVIFLAIVAVLGIALFYTERVQKKMFFSGSGTLEDIRLSNPDFFTAGRSHLWDLMIEEIRTKAVWGHGANASEEFVLSVTWGTLTHPHNDWLRLLYDYGFIGASVFAFCLVAQVIHLLKRAKMAFGKSRILLYAGASSFLPFVLLMFTDNVILYATFFGNLQFTILGLVYAAEKTREIDALNYYRHFATGGPLNPGRKMNYHESHFGGVGGRVGSLSGVESRS